MASRRTGRGVSLVLGIAREQNPSHCSSSDASDAKIEVLRDNEELFELSARQILRSGVHYRVDVPESSIRSWNHLRRVA